MLLSQIYISTCLAIFANSETLIKRSRLAFSDNNYIYILFNVDGDSWSQQYCWARGEIH